VKDLLFVFLGGGVGASIRWALQHVITFPVAVLLVNCVGSFFIGYILQKFPASHEMKMLIVTGFLGGLTTFSGFSMDVLKFFQTGELFKAMAYIFASLFCGILLCYLGYRLAL
jgi:CrcB protein